MPLQNARCYSMTLALEIGDRPAQIVNQIHFWLEKPGTGVAMQGRKWIYNSLEDWLKPENFPCWSKSTLRRAFDKLVDLGIVVRKQLAKMKSNRVYYYTLNYFHQLLVKAGYSSCVQNEHMEDAKMNRPCVQNGHMDVSKMDTSINTDTTHRKPEKTYKEGRSKFFLSSSSKEKTYRKEYPEAEAWLEKQEKDFSKEVEKYARLHCNTPKVNYPHALRQKIIVEIWKKYTGRSSITDFEYVDKSKLDGLQSISISARRQVYDGLEEEMEALHGKSVYVQ